jgi:hypothetical protein
MYQGQEELDESFQLVVRRAMTPFKEDNTPEKPNLDDQNRTFRTRFVGVWLLSNAILAISIQNLNGLDQTNNLLDSCLTSAGVDTSTGTVADGSSIAALNATCITNALNLDNTNLHDKQQVKLDLLRPTRMTDFADILSIPIVDHIRLVRRQIRWCNLLLDQAAIRTVRNSGKGELEFQTTDQSDVAEKTKPTMTYAARRSMMVH